MRSFHSYHSARGLGFIEFPSAFNELKLCLKFNSNTGDDIQELYYSIDKRLRGRLSTQRELSVSRGQFQPRGWLLIWQLRSHCRLIFNYKRASSSARFRSTG